jgi:hypothetical protein
MIIKKLWNRCKIWQCKEKETEYQERKHYIGYFLFGFIPLYLIKIDDYIDIRDIKTNKYEESITKGIYRKHKEKLVK